MFYDINEYLNELFSWCNFNCFDILNILQNNNNKPIINKPLNSDLFDDWVDYGFGENE